MSLLAKAASCPCVCVCVCVYVNRVFAGSLCLGMEKKLCGVLVSDALPLCAISLSPPLWMCAEQNVYRISMLM